MSYGVYRDANSRCCLMVTDDGLTVQYIAVIEEGGTMRTDVFAEEATEFHGRYQLLPDYPVKRAAGHYLHPLTPSIEVSPQANRYLSSIIQEKHMSTDTNSATPAKKAPAKKAAPGQKQVNAASAASVRTSSKVSDAPTVAAVKTKKPTAAEQKAAVKKIAAQKAAEKEAAAKKKQDEKDATAAKKAAAKGKAPPKVVKAAKAAKAAAKPRKATPAKKVAKLVRKPGTTAPAKTAAKGKGAKPAKKEKAGRTGRFTDDQKISILVKENPKREGTGAHEIFEMLRKSKTVGEFYKKGGGSHNLRWNIDHGYISVK